MEDTNNAMKSQFAVTGALLVMKLIEAK